MTYKLVDHTADIAVEATGETLGNAFAAAADGMAAAICDEIPDTGDRISIEAEGESKEAALFEYLDELILQRDVQHILPVDNTAKVTEVNGNWIVEASTRGVPLSEVTAREIKAVTYSEMNVAKTDDSWSLYVVFDV
ncbi:archease [Salinarchaeum sp. IM2453]|uniref:archease n=1 Tax=Salinarchaeum sp. IM2453 TaxID=2862870 RepID=UPI001C8281DA|nr:archease [Salinarchaeum sp. IM2453]QZA87683.1 archease [Salinarchaeum sp. IM2453]